MWCCWPSKSPDSLHVCSMTYLLQVSNDNTSKLFDAIVLRNNCFYLQPVKNIRQQSVGTSASVLYIISTLLHDMDVLDFCEQHVLTLCGNLMR